MTETYTVEECMNIGFAHGQSLFEHNVRDVKDYHAIVDGEMDDNDDFDVSQFEDDIRALCWEADEGYRQYSPFEFFCKALNDDENSEELWEAYEQGISAGVDECIEELTAKFYMTTQEAHKVVQQWLESKDD